MTPHPGKGVEAGRLAKSKNLKKIQEILSKAQEFNKFSNTHKGSTLQVLDMGDMGMSFKGGGTHNSLKIPQKQYFACLPQCPVKPPGPPPHHPGLSSFPESPHSRPPGRRVEQHQRRRAGQHAGDRAVLEAQRHDAERFVTPLLQRHLYENHQLRQHLPRPLPVAGFPPTHRQTIIFHPDEDKKCKNNYAGFKKNVFE